MKDFFRFPHTPHLVWLGQGSPRDDKVLSPYDAIEILSDKVVVEEKLDGANLGFSVNENGQIRVQNRGQYLERPFHGQFSRLASWLPAHHDDLAAALGPNLILFGEWCAARHSLEYLALPDWLLVFDVYDRKVNRFWSATRRDEFVAITGLAVVPHLFAGKINLDELERLMLHQQSQFRQGPLEGVVVRKEDGNWLNSRAKIVHPDFTQAIAAHWSRRPIEWNRIQTAEEQG